MHTKGCEKGYLYVALIVIVLMGGIIASQHATITEQQTDLNKLIPDDLPVCHFSAVTSWEGGGAHPGYWIELDNNLEKRECIMRADEGRTVPIQDPW
jgi:hypothetical protein